MRMFIAVAAAIAATSVSFAVATAANQPTPVAQSSATDAAVVRQLKALNRAVGRSNKQLANVNRAIGGTYYLGMRKQIDDLKGAVEKTTTAADKTSRNIGDSNYGSGMRNQIRELQSIMQDVCRSVRPTNVGYSCM